MNKLEFMTRNVSTVLLTIYLGLPTTAGISILGAESPAMPALQKPEPLSSTMALKKTTTKRTYFICDHYQEVALRFSNC